MDNFELIQQMLKNLEKTEIHTERMEQLFNEAVRLIPRWIPVSERLPEPFELVYVYVPTEQWVTDAYMTRHNEWVGVRMNREVTHWMPLPEPPKEV